MTHQAAQVLARAALRPALTPTKSGLCEGTHIATLAGHLPVEYLSEGDRIITRNGARTLRRITPHALGDCPIEVSKGAFGSARPERDLHLGPEQLVHLKDWNNGALWGSDLSLVAISRLVDQRRIQWGEHPGHLVSFILAFDEDETIFAEGMEIPCPAQSD